MAEVDPERFLFRIAARDDHAAVGGTYVATLRVTSRGRMTIPKAVRDELGIQPGDRIEYVPQEDGSYIAQRVK